jgi:hypothetical protein
MQKTVYDAIANIATPATKNIDTSQRYEGSIFEREVGVFAELSIEKLLFLRCCTIFTFFKQRNKSIWRVETNNQTYDSNHHK